MLVYVKGWFRGSFPKQYVRCREGYYRIRQRRGMQGLIHALRHAAGAADGALHLITLPLRLLLAPLQIAPFLPMLLDPGPIRATRTGGNGTKTIVMLAISEVWRDPRIEREARALANAGFEVEILYPDYSSHIAHDEAMQWGPRIKFSPLPALHYTFVFGFPYLFGAKYLRAAKRRRPFAFHAHDLNTSLIALAAARAAGCHCVCDFHEWFSENASWSPVTQSYRPHHRVKKTIFRWAERLAVRKATAVITVCDPIARALSEASGTERPVLVVRNLPSTNLQAPGASSRRSAPGRGLRSAMGIRPEDFVVLYSGGTGPSRLIEPVIEAIALTRRAVLVIRGPSIERYGPGYMELAHKLGIGHRVFCLPSLPPARVVDAASEADAGLYTVANVCKNFYYALPNKLFEYLAAGIPLLVADYPEVRRVVNAYEVGLTFDPYDPKSIAAQIDRLSESAETRERFRRNAVVAWRELSADSDWHKLARLYRDLAAAQRHELV